METYAIGVRFVDEDGTVQAGELINPFRVSGGQVIIEEYVGDAEVDVMIPAGSLATERIARTHISRVSAMFPCEGIPLIPIERDVTIFDQDAQ